jgi:hypothetical protein
MPNTISPPAMVNEHQVRAAAGLTMVAGAVAFSFAYFQKVYWPLEAVSVLFAAEFALLVTAGLDWSPVGALSPDSHRPTVAGLGVGPTQALRLDAGLAMSRGQPSSGSAASAAGCRGRSACAWLVARVRARYTVEARSTGCWSPRLGPQRPGGHLRTGLRDPHPATTVARGKRAAREPAMSISTGTSTGINCAGHRQRVAGRSGPRCRTPCSPSQPSGQAAVTDAVSGRTLSYGELASAVRGVAAGLAAHGLRPGDTFAILAPNSPEWLVACHGAIAAGGVVSGLNPLWSADEIAAQIPASAARFLVTETAFLPTARAAAELTAASRQITVSR